MKKCILIITILVITLFIISETYLTVKVDSRVRISSQTVRYIMNVTGPEAIGAGVVTPINFSVSLNDPVNPGIGVNVTIEIPPNERAGMYFVEGNTSVFTRTLELGDFSPSEAKKAFVLINSTGNDTFMLVKCFLFEQDVQQYVKYYNREDKDWLTGMYVPFGIALTFPDLKLRGPLEIPGQVVPRVRLIENEEITLTYNISNIRGDPIVNLIIWFESPDTLEILSTNATNVDSFEPETSLLVVIKGQCVVNYASVKRFHFYIDADNIELRERVVKVQTYDWYNPLKIDNKIALITWPLIIVVMAAYTVLFIRFSWKKHKEQIRITKELEERYGRALDVPD